MPLYEYRCHRCGKTFEALQKFSDEPIKVHEDCGGEVERLLSPPALQFKGTGWYVTDYARNGGSKHSTESKSDSKGDSSKSDSKTGESKNSETKNSPAKTESKPAPSSSSSK